MCCLSLILQQVFSTNASRLFRPFTMLRYIRLAVIYTKIIPYSETVFITILRNNHNAFVA